MTVAATLDIQPLSGLCTCRNNDESVEEKLPKIALRKSALNKHQQRDVWCRLGCDLAYRHCDHS